MPTHAEVDPELEYLIANGGDDLVIEVSLLLRAEADPQALLGRLGLANNPQIVHSFVERVRVLSVQARIDIIRQLVAQPEVEMASAALNDE
jgi:hypothetical protein